MKESKFFLPKLTNSINESLKNNKFLGALKFSEILTCTFDMPFQTFTK